MSYLFYIDDKNNCVIHPDCVKLCPSLSVLDEKEVLLIVLIYDYHSIFRQWAEQERVRKAMVHVYGEIVHGLLEEPKMKAAIEDYKSLQYDPREEQVARLRNKVSKMYDKLDLDDAPSASKATLQTIEILNEQIKNLENEQTNIILNKGVIKGGAELSFLEQLMRSQKYYASVIAKR
jgi:uncharacterized protein YutE (UPF0331/DUF86 family)